MSKSNLGTAGDGAGLHHGNSFVLCLEDRTDGLKESELGLNG